jgi:hypothetical protein
MYFQILLFISTLRRCITVGEQMAASEQAEAGAYTRPLLSSTPAVFVTETKKYSQCIPHKSAQVKSKSGRV